MRDIVQRIPKARVYERRGSRLLQIQFELPDGRLVRKSSGVADENEAWRLLEREYTRLTQISWKEAVVDFFAVKSRPGGLREKTLQGYRTSLLAVDSIFGDLSLAEINVEQIKKFVRERRAKVSDTSVRRDLAFASSVFTHAQVSMDGAPENNPFIGYSKRHLKERARDTYLTLEEFERLEKSCVYEWHRVVLAVAVHTGMRHGELLQFRKSWINWDRGAHGEIQLPREFTKSKRPRIIPVFPEIAHTLKDWCARHDGPYVFSRWSREEKAWVPYTSFSGFFRGARTRAGLKNLHFHDLRHTFASWWMQNSGDLLVLKEMLGHSTLQMVQRYAHLDTEAAHRALERRNARTL